MYLQILPNNHSGYINQKLFWEGIRTMDSSYIRWRAVLPAYRPVVGALALAICGQSFLPEENIQSDRLGENYQQKEYQPCKPGKSKVCFCWNPGRVLIIIY